MSSSPGEGSDWDEPVLSLNDLKRAFEQIRNAPPAPPAPHHPKCDLALGRGFCNCPTGDFERQVRGG